ncbi:Prohibitin-2, subunit of the prohibitin complex (Phb1p-Phb2p) [Branchiostoma belcheri]|nr:Prohibitin-2, subunit of the prohibitin complex (Phb1p-Phb2p) [Branchiostoma belcheri]
MFKKDRYSTNHGPTFSSAMEKRVPVVGLFSVTPVLILLLTTDIISTAPRAVLDFINDTSMGFSRKHWSIHHSIPKPVFHIPPAVFNLSYKVPKIGKPKRKSSPKLHKAVLKRNRLSPHHRVSSGLVTLQRIRTAAVSIGPSYFTTITMDGRGNMAEEPAHACSWYGQNPCVPTNEQDSDRFDTCAIVGSGDILTGSLCGTDIDANDYVIRFNLAPTRRTDLFRSLLQLASTSNISITLQHINAQHLAGQIIMKIFPRYDRDFDSYVTTGLIGVVLATTLCNKITLYGFYPFDTDPLTGRNLSYHYYLNTDGNLGEPNFKIHNFKTEYKVLRALEKRGLLTLVTEPCLDLSAHAARGMQANSGWLRHTGLYRPSEAPEGETVASQQHVNIVQAVFRFRDVRSTGAVHPIESEGTFAAPDGVFTYRVARKRTPGVSSAAEGAELGRSLADPGHVHSRPNGIGGANRPQDVAVVMSVVEGDFWKALDMDVAGMQHSRDNSVPRTIAMGIVLLRSADNTVMN